MNYHPTIHGFDEDTSKVNLEGRKRVVARFEEGSYRLSYYLKNAEFEELTKLFEPRPISYDNKDKRLTRHPHPVPAELNKYAYNKCIENAANYPSAMDIGGTPLRTPDNIHMCNLVNGPRTQARYINAFLMKDHNLFRYDRMCKKGAEHCDFIAPYAFMINVYDVSIYDIPKIMSKHSTLVLDIWMYLPLILHNKYFTVDQTHYRAVLYERCNFDRMVDNYRIGFFFPNDSSNIYVHDYVMWKNYLTVTQIQSGDDIYLLEHIETLGTFTNIRVTWCNNAKLERRLFRAHNMCGLHDMYVIPDVVYYYTKLHAAGFIYEKSFMLEKTHVDNILKWCQRQADNAFNYPNFASAFDAKSISVYYTVEKQQRLVYKGLIVDHLDYENIQISLFMIGAINRFKRTQLVGSMFNFLKNCDHSWWDLFKHKCRVLYYSLVQELEGPIGHSRDWNFYNDGDEEPTYFPEVKIRVMKQHYSNDVIISDVYEHGDATFIPASDFMLTRADTFPVSVPVIGEDVEIKQITTPSEENRFGPEQGSWPLLNPAEHKVVYDPPGDGACGLHAVRYFHQLYKKSKQLVLPQRYCSLGQVYGNVSGKLHSPDELAEICYANEMNLILHMTDVKFKGLRAKKYIYDNTWPAAKLMLIGGVEAIGHYQVVDCECSNDYIGDYVHLHIDDKHLYINCANESLSDGAGQALAFRQMFPAYDNGVKKPIDPCVFMSYKPNGVDFGAELGLCVAHNMKSVDDRQAMQRRLDLIFESIEAHCLKNNIAVYMPLIGTAIFGNDLCCVKTRFLALKCRKVLCLFDSKQENNYYKCDRCIHGGYKTLGDGRPLKTLRSHYDNSNWLKIAPTVTEDKMLIKYRDIENVASKYPSVKCIHEIACAPGHFATVQNKRYNYVPYHYKPGVPITKKIEPFAWSEYNQLPKFGKGDMVLLDCTTDIGDPFHQNALEWLKRGAVITSKFMAYLDDETTNDVSLNLAGYYNEYRIDIWHNDGTEITSSELYYTVSNTESKYATIDIDKTMQKIDEENLKKYNSLTCKCDYKRKFECNANLTFDTDKDQYEQFKRTLLADNMVVKHMDDKIKKEIAKAKLSDVTNIQAKLGVAGCGKSQETIRNYCGSCALIIAPLKAVVDQHNQHKMKQCDSRAVTFIKAITLLNTYKDKYKIIFVDEIFLVNPYFLSIYRHLSPSSVYIGLGDKFQIITDFTGNSPSYRVEELGTYIYDSSRSPKVIEPYIKRYIKDFNGNSKRKGELLTGDIKNIKRYPNDVILCATQKMKQYLQDTLHHKGVMTIHEAMGNTYHTIHVCTSDIDKIHTDRPRYVYTALTRATDRIVMYGTGEEIEHFYEILGSPIERTMDSPIVDAIPHADIKRADIESVTRVEEPIRTLQKQVVNIDMIQDILAKVYVKKNEFIDSKTLGYKINLLTMPENDEHLKIPLNLLEPIDVKITGRMMGKTPLQATYHGSDTFGMLNTITSRYMGVQKKELSKEKYKFLEMHHVRGILKFMKPKHLRSQLIIGKDVVWDGVCEYLIKLQAKFKNVQTTEPINERELRIYDKLVSDEPFKCIVQSYVEAFTSKGEYESLKEAYEYRIAELMSNEKDASVFQQLNSEWYSRVNNSVQFHMKSQPKEIRELYWDTSDKAGQGVSAWSKISNVILSAMQKPYHDWIKRNLLDNVLWAVDKSDREFAEEFKAKGLSWMVSDKSFDIVPADASSFDQSQITPGTSATMQLYYFAGGQSSVAHYYVDKREQSFISTVTSKKNDNLVLHADFVYRQGMHSGCKMTLTGNTLYNMAMIGSEIKYKKLGFGLFKGDDVLLAVIGQKFELYDGKKMSDICGYKIKWLTNPIPEFIANFITPHGFFPDVLRRTSRVVGRLVTHPEQWEEMRRSVADSISVCNGDIEVELGAQCAAMHYQHHGINITKDEVLFLLSFLQQVTWDDKLSPKITGNWEILYADITRMVDGMRAMYDSVCKIKPYKI